MFVETSTDFLSEFCPVCFQEHKEDFCCQDSLAVSRGGFENIKKDTTKKKTQPLWCVFLLRRWEKELALAGESGSSGSKLKALQWCKREFAAENRSRVQLPERAALCAQELWEAVVRTHVYDGSNTSKPRCRSADISKCSDIAGNGKATSDIWKGLVLFLWFLLWNIGGSFKGNFGETKAFLKQWSWHQQKQAIKGAIWLLLLYKPKMWTDAFHKYMSDIRKRWEAAQQRLPKNRDNPTLF